MIKYASAVLAVSLLFCVSAAQSAQYKFDFSATGAWIGSHVKPSADSQVSGSFIFTAASVGDTPTTIDAVSLVLDGHSFGLADVGFRPWGYRSLLAGGTHNGVNAMAGGTNDFSLHLNLYENEGTFSYTSEVHPSRIWDSTSFTYSYTPLATVPEADTYAMLLAGLGVMGLLARRRKNQA